MLKKTNVADGEAAQTVKWRTPTCIFRIISSFLRAHLPLSLFYFMDLAPNIPKALTAYRNHEYLSVRATARAYSLLPTTLRRYLSGGVSHAISHISKQYLSPAEDKVLIKYILRLDSFGNPVSLVVTGKACANWIQLNSL
jgi:hypothetical protein